MLLFDAAAAAIIFDAFSSLLFAAADAAALIDADAAADAAAP